MKKQNKLPKSSLKLARETIRSLAQNELRIVEGARLVVRETAASGQDVCCA